MICRKCGAEIPADEQQCGACGWKIPDEQPIYLEMTAAEARDGCVKTINSPRLARPLRLRLKPRIRDGKVLLVNNAKVVNDDGNVVECPIRVQVVVKSGRFTAPKAAPAPGQKPHNSSGRTVLMVLGIIVALACIVAAIWGVVSVLTDSTPKPNDSGVSQGESGNPDTPGTEENRPAQPGDPYIPVYEIPHLDQRYFLKNLDEKSRNVIFAMYDSLMNFHESCTLPEQVTASDLADLLLIMKAECPELLQVNPAGSVRITENTDSGFVTQVHWDYLMQAAEYQSMLTACQDVVDALVASVSNMGEWEKEKVAFDFIANSAQYSADGKNAGNAYGILVDRLGKCDGISAAMQWVLEDMGIPCFTLYGDAVDGSAGHAWNVIMINGKYYDLDVTADIQAEGTQKPIVYQAFNVSDTWVRGQYKLNKAYSRFESIPGTPDMSGSYYMGKGQFVEAGANYDEMFAKQFYKAVPDERGYFMMQFESLDDMHNFTANLKSMMETQAAAHNVASVKWECNTYEAYHTVYVKIIKE